MRFALWSELSKLALTVVPAVLSLPHNVSILRLPWTSVATKPVNPDTSLLGDWPPVPWTFTQEAYEIRFDQYGRKEDELDKSRRPEIVAGIKGLREYFLDRTTTKNTAPIHLEAGIINFSIGFTGRPLWTGHEVSAALAPLEFFNADETWTLVEIINAQTGTPNLWVPLGAFQVEFKKPEGTRPSHLRPVTATRL